MIRRVILILLALMCLATTIGPAVADTAATMTPPADPTIYDEVRAGKPGAFEKLQLRLMNVSLAAGLNAYLLQTGRWPATVEELLDAGLLPFRPLLSVTQTRDVVGINSQELPPTQAIGICLRATECRLICLGADGDPLVPLIEELPRGFTRGWPLEYPWSARLASILEGAVISSCVAHERLTGSLPTSPMALQETLGLVPVGASWQQTATAPACGVRIEIDSTGKYLRATRYPDPGYGQVTTYALMPPPNSRGNQLKPQVWLQVLPLSWEEFGTLAVTTPVPAALTTWEPPAPPVPQPGVFPEYSVALDRNDIALQMFAWYGNYYCRNTGNMPSPQWLVANTHPLHYLLDAERHRLPYQAFGEFQTWNDHPTFGRDTSAVLIGAGEPITVTGGLRQPQVTIIAPTGPLKPDSDQPFLGIGTASLSLSSTKSQLASLGGFALTYKKSDPVITAAASDWLADNPVPDHWPLRDWYWESAEQQDGDFEHGFAMHAAANLASCYGEWRARPAAPIRPASWDQVLYDLALEPANYVLLSAEEPPQVPYVTCELAVEPSGRFFQMRVSLPNGDRTRKFLRVKYEAGAYLDFPNYVSLKNSPEVATLTYEPLFSFAIPIPDPPVLPEASTP